MAIYDTFTMSLDTMTGAFGLQPRGGCSYKRVKGKQVKILHDLVTVFREFLPYTSLKEFGKAVQKH